MPERKACLYCGEQIISSAKLCHFCKTWQPIAGTKQCTACCEWILADAKKCKCCGEWQNNVVQINTSPPAPSVSSPRIGRVPPAPTAPPKKVAEVKTSKTEVKPPVEKEEVKAKKAEATPVASKPKSEEVKQEQAKSTPPKVTPPKTEPVKETPVSTESVPPVQEAKTEPAPSSKPEKSEVKIPQSKSEEKGDSGFEPKAFNRTGSFPGKKLDPSLLKRASGLKERLAPTIKSRGFSKEDLAKLDAKDTSSSKEEKKSSSPDVSKSPEPATQAKDTSEKAKSAETPAPEKKAEASTPPAKKEEPEVKAPESTSPEKVETPVEKVEPPAEKAEAPAEKEEAPAPEVKAEAKEEVVVKAPETPAEKEEEAPSTVEIKQEELVPPTPEPPVEQKAEATPEPETKKEPLEEKAKAEEPKAEAKAEAKEEKPAATGGSGAHFESILDTLIPTSDEPTISKKKAVVSAEKAEAPAEKAEETKGSEPLLKELPKEILDADLVLEDVMQSLEPEEFKMMEVLGNAKRMFWGPLKDVIPFEKSESLGEFLEYWNLSPIRLAIRETAHQLVAVIASIYHQELEEHAGSSSLPPAEIDALRLDSQRQANLLTIIRNPFREFIERLEQLDQAKDALLHSLKEDAALSEHREQTLFLQDIAKELEQLEEAQGIETIWSLLLDSIKKGMSGLSGEVAEEVEEMGRTMEAFSSQFEPTYSAILDRILEIWSEQLTPSLLLVK